MEIVGDTLIISKIHLKFPERLLRILAKADTCFSQFRLNQCNVSREWYVLLITEF